MDIFLLSQFWLRKIQCFVPLINSFVSFAPFMSSNEISVTNSRWYFYSVFPLWKRQTNLISCHFKTLTSKKCIIQFHTQGLRHALHILSSKTNAIRILNQIKHKWQGGKGYNKHISVSWVLMFSWFITEPTNPGDKVVLYQSEGWGEFEISYLPWAPVCGLPRLSWSDLGTFRADSYGQSAIHCFYLNLHLALLCSPLLCLC